MGNIINPDIVPLIQGFKPYLGTGGQSIADSITQIINAVSNEQFQNAVQAVIQAIPRKTQEIVSRIVGDGEVNEQTASSPDITNTSQSFLSGNFAFVLFLILILLFYGDGSW